MKITRIVVMLALASILFAGSALAGTITWNCTTTSSIVGGLSGQSAGNTITPTCTTIDAAAAPGSIYLSVVMNAVLDFTYNKFADALGTSTTTWAVNGPGNLDFAGVLVTLPGGSAPRPVSVSSNGDAATIALFKGYGNGPIATSDWGALPNISYVGNKDAVTGATADFQFVVTYDTAPEPATMAMLGSALLGLGLFGRKRFAR